MLNDNPMAYLFKKTWQYSAGNRRNLLWAWSMLVVSKTLELFLQPLIWAMIINIIQAQGITHVTISRLTWLLVASLVLEPIVWLFHGPARIKEQINAFKARANYREYLLKGVLRFSMAWHVENHSGNTIDKIEKGTGALYSFSEDSFEPVYSIVELMVSYVMLAYLSHSAAYIVLGMIFTSAYITIRFDRVIIGNYKQLSRAENKISESVFDAISNISTVIILRVEKLVFQAIMAKVEQPFELQKRTNLLNELKWFMTSLCSATMVVIVLVVYFRQAMSLDHPIMIGSVYLIIQYLGRISNVFFRFNNMYGNFVKYKARVMNAEELAKEFTTQSEPYHALPDNWQRICIENLNFTYHTTEGENLHLENVSICANSGERIALIGRTGCGKSTLLRVWRKLFPALTMRLTVDGQTLASGFAGISGEIALVPQDPEIFSDTILYNLTFGDAYSMEQVLHCTDMACVTDVIEGLPLKFQSSAKERGVNLSGGEKQRLALARGLLKCHDKSIVLLDEPTSSVDSVTEMEIYRNIFREFRDKTIISSVHKLHLLPLFDRIYMFDGGKIVTSGTFSELLVTSPRFASLWTQYHEEQKNEIDMEGDL